MTEAYQGEGAGSGMLLTIRERAESHATAGLRDARYRELETAGRQQKR